MTLLAWMGAQLNAIILKRMQRFIQMVKDILEIARCNQKRCSGEKRHVLAFKEGDLIMPHGKAFREPSRSDLSNK